MVLCSPGWPWTHYLAEDELKLLIPLPPSPTCWNGMCMPIILIIIIQQLH